MVQLLHVYCIYMYMIKSGGPKQARQTVDSYFALLSKVAIEMYMESCLNQVLFYIHVHVHIHVHIHVLTMYHMG